MDGLILNWQERSNVVEGTEAPAAHSSTSFGSAGSGSSASSSKLRRVSIASISIAILDGDAGLVSSSKPNSISLPITSCTSNSDPWHIAERNGEQKGDGGQGLDFAEWRRRKSEAAERDRGGVAQSKRQESMLSVKQVAAERLTIDTAKREAAALQAQRKQDLVSGTIRVKREPVNAQSFGLTQRRKGCRNGPVLVDETTDALRSSSTVPQYNRSARRASSLGPLNNTSSSSSTGRAHLGVGAAYPGYADHNPWTHSFRDRDVDAELYTGHFAVK